MTTTKKILIILLSLNLQNIHSQNGKTYYTDTIKLNDKNLPIDSNTLYFPKYIFFDNYDYPMYDNKPSGEKLRLKKLHALLENQKFSHALFLFDEPILYSRPLVTEKLRILLLPSFTKPFCLNIDNETNNANLTLKTLSGKGGYWYSKPMTNSQTKITKAQCDSLFNLFKQSPTLKEKTILDTPSSWLDGSYYIIEFCTKNQYYVFFRRETEDKNISELINEVLRITKSDIKKTDY